METGVIKRWFEDRAFGFIKSDDGGDDVFFHLNALQDDAEPKAGNRVSYKVANGRNGKMQAVSVQLIYEP